ncbi:transcriptional repressor [Clostridium sp. MSJ-8]|uniref:Fur family transcriptional regulator n=1 Tax=Clostridium sp. MSJ-8 TaxID=2841510 RepID=UPI001C0E91D2|nr:Fur family transcriptional regulator [Clostridium sp. MSJ-8]MBU5487803.1 transcriptional repressor [Clostridium sp. MSJ-8]
MAKAIDIDYDVLKEELKKRGCKLTPQRRSIVDTIVDSEGKHLTAEEIYDEVKKRCPEIGLATVYRTITLLEEIGIVSRLQLNDGCSRYEIVHRDEKHRHHHLICNNCNEVFEVEDDLLDDLEEDIKTKYGFLILDHSVKFYGYCKACQEKMKDIKK